MGYPTAATAGYLAKLQVGSNDDLGTAVFTNVAEVKDINGPGWTSTVEDATNHDSQNGYEEIVPTILMGDNVTFNCNDVPTDPTQDGSTGFQALLQGRTRRAWRLVKGNSAASKITFHAYVIKVSPKNPVKGLASVDCELKVNGAPVFS